MRETFGGRRKIVEYVPSSFKEAWSDYLKRWSSFVDYYVDNMKGVDELLISPPQVYTDEMLPRGETRFVYPLHKPNPECEAEFDPAIHDGRNIYEMAETLLANRVEDDPAFADYGSAASGIACDYLYFLRTDLRMDFAGIERRWRMVPLFLRPRHVVEYDLAAQLSLYSNLENAVTAFIFGAVKAASALCRATLEMVLRDFYAPNPVPRHLNEVIKSASRDHELIRLNKDQIYRFKDMADAALHKQDTGKVTDAVKREKDVALFMELLAILIECAPAKLAE